MRVNSWGVITAAVLSLSLSMAQSPQNLSDSPGAIGNLLREGRPSEALALAKQKLEEANKTLAASDPVRIAILKALCEAEYRMGHSADAIQTLEDNIAELDGHDPQGLIIADLQLTLASLYGLSGKQLEAEELAVNAEKVFESLPEDDPRLGKALLALSIQKRALGKTIDELPLLKRALMILSTSADPANAPALKMTLEQLASFYDNAGEPEKAADYRNRATHVAVVSTVGDEFNDSSKQGIAAMNAGDYRGASAAFERSLRAVENKYGDNDPLASMTKQWLATSYLAEGDRVRAKPFMIAIANELYSDFSNNFPLMNEQERIEFATNSDLRFGLFCTYVHQFHGNDPELVGLMYDLALWSKGAALTTSNRANQRLRDSKDPQLKELSARLEAVQQRYRQASLSPADPAINRIRADRLQLEREIARKIGLGAERTVHWREVQSRLRQDEAAVEVLRFPYNDGRGRSAAAYYADGRARSATDYYAALILRSGWANPKYVYLGDDQEIERVEGRRYRDYATAKTPFAAHSRFPFWDTLENAIGSSIRRIYISPDGILNNISFAILPTAGGKLVIDVYDVRILSGTRDLTATIPVMKNDKRAVLVGYPNFDMSLTEDGNLTHRGNVRGASQDWRPLLSSKDEVIGIKRLLDMHGWKVQGLYDNQATKQLVVRGVIQHPRLLHFATHGYFSAERGGAGPAIVAARIEGAMLNAGLVFAGANFAKHSGAPGGFDRTVLTAYEISSFDLRGTDLVVLSACESGVGDTLGGEVFGLRRALHTAGADKLLMTLWEVPDKATAQLLAYFYEAWLSGLDSHSALRTAQLKVRSTNPLPYFWGAFVLVGRGHD